MVRAASSSNSVELARRAPNGIAVGATTVDALSLASPNKGKTLAGMIATRASAQRRPPTILRQNPTESQGTFSAPSTKTASPQVAELVATYANISGRVSASERAWALSTMVHDLDEHLRQTASPAVKLGLGVIRLQAAMFKHLSLLESASSEADL